mmetsp:Transcript_29939/g.89029  ORF Transcript_29939/g.89029 Transcript_29939/m.89029 type:complete len:201 (-) Transcript_29939:1544-2146(-)
MAQIDQAARDAGAGVVVPRNDREAVPRGGRRLSSQFLSRVAGTKVGTAGDDSRGGGSVQSSHRGVGGFAGSQAKGGRILQPGGRSPRGRSDLPPRSRSLPRKLGAGRAPSSRNHRGVRNRTRPPRRRRQGQASRQRQGGRISRLHRGGGRQDLQPEGGQYSRLRPGNQPPDSQGSVRPGVHARHRRRLGRPLLRAASRGH